jgi:hypothetical protein
MTKVGKLDGEGTYAGTRGNDGDAPIPDLPLVRPSRLVIEANPLKYSVMAARSLALGLLLLLCVTPVGWAAEPAGATVVLQLPASMSPDQVKGLIADLAAKGAEPAVTSVDPPSADPPPLMTGMKLTVRIWVRHVEAEGGTRDDALRFWAIALAALVAAPVIGLGARPSNSDNERMMHPTGQSCWITPA